MAISPRLKPGHTGNRLLDRLTAVEFKELAPQLDPMRIPSRHVLFQADDQLDYLYFPVSAVLSLLVSPTSSNGQCIEIANVGNEGLVGFTALLGAPTSFHYTACQLPGVCLRLPVPILAEAMNRRPSVARLVNKYVAIAYRTVVQGVVCNALHHAEQRLCRWLLVTHEKAAGGFPATQGLLAARLGVKRPTVSVIANSLLKNGLITYHRGAVQILDRDRLEHLACDCFKITRVVYEQILEH
jgi:CRP-like cAMP-binding protein